nr:hypothetical protein [uncultured Oscillibacter sp.]
MQIATLDQQEAVANDLVEFVHRVALDKNATPAEIAALPEVAKVLCGLMPGFS